MSMSNHVLTPAGLAATDVRITSSLRRRLLPSERSTWQNLPAPSALLVRRVAKVLHMVLPVTVRRDKLKVLRLVIQLVPVLVVNVLTTVQRTTEYLLHHTTVRESSPLWRREVVVPILRDMTTPPLAFRGGRAIMPNQAPVVLVAQVTGHDFTLALVNAAR
jgi:hypothetical protein